MASYPPAGVQKNKKLINEAYERAGFLDSLRAAWSGVEE
jgi:hypothetical protein